MAPAEQVIIGIVVGRYAYPLLLGMPHPMLNVLPIIWRMGSRLRSSMPIAVIFLVTVLLLGTPSPMLDVWPMMAMIWRMGGTHMLSSMPIAVIVVVIVVVVVVASIICMRMALLMAMDSPNTLLVGTIWHSWQALPKR